MTYIVRDPYLAINSVTFEDLPATKAVKVRHPKSRNEVITVNGVRVSREAVSVQGGVITIDPDQNWAFTPEVKDLIEEIWLGSNSFILQETYTDPRYLRTWLGAEFASEPQIEVWTRSEDELLFTLTSTLVINVGVPQ